MKIVGQTGDRVMVRMESGATIEYRIQNGTAYHATTPQEVIDTLEWCRQQGRLQRIVLDYGQTTKSELIPLGQSWGDVHDTRGSVSRSMGTLKVPLLIKTARSMGGGGILDNCIVGILTSPGGKVLYRHHQWSPAPSRQEAKQKLASLGVNI